VNAPRPWTIVRRSVVQWTEDRIPRRAAALAFYAGFSLAPLLLIAIAIGGLAFGADAVRGRVVGQLQGLLGPDAARAIETMLKNTRTTGSNVIATAAGVLTLLVGASGVFGELQDSLNEIWKVKKKPGRGWRGAIRDRFFSFTLVLGSGFLLLVSLLIDAALEAVTVAMTGWFGSTLPFRLAGMALSFSVISGMFAIMFKVMPDAETRWRDVLVGALLTATLFTLGKWLIGLYLGHSALASSYGAAGSFVVLLLWLYYSCQVVLFGAEATHAVAHTLGSPPLPRDDAMSLEMEPPREAVAPAGRDPEKSR